MEQQAETTREPPQLRLGPAAPRPFDALPTLLFVPCIVGLRARWTAEAAATIGPPLLPPLTVLEAMLAVSPDLLLA